MSTNQSAEVPYAAQVSKTLFSLPVYMQVELVGYIGQITEISIHIIHFSAPEKKIVTVQ